MLTKADNLKLCYFFEICIGFTQGRFLSIYKRIAAECTDDIYSRIFHEFEILLALSERTVESNRGNYRYCCSDKMIFYRYDLSFSRALAVDCKTTFYNRLKILDFSYGLTAVPSGRRESNHACSLCWHGYLSASSSLNSIPKPGLSFAYR